MAWTQEYHLTMLESMKKVSDALKIQGDQRIMDRYRFPETGQSSRAKGNRCHTYDVIRRIGSSSDQPIKRPSFEEIEISQAIDRGKDKMQKYQQEAERYQNKDRDTFEEFKKNLKTDIKIDDYIAEVSSVNSSGEYKNEIDIKNGRIIGINNNHEYPDSDEKLNFSEIVFNQLRLVMEHLNKDILGFNLKCWYGDTITNKETKKTVNHFFPEEIDVDRSVKEGEKIFLAGTDAFIALAGTPTAQSKFYLLAQHSNAFKSKKVQSITVIRQVYSIIDINYEFGS